MNKSAKILTAFALLAVVACNNRVSREDLVATVGGAPVYRADVNFIVGTMPQEQRVGQARNDAIVRALETKIRAQAARHHIGDPHGTVAQLVKSLRNRSLSETYQYFYLNENLGYSNDTLQAFLKANDSLYASDSLTKGDFTLLRSRVAADKLLRDRPEELKAFYQKNASQYGDWTKDSVRQRVEADFVNDYRNQLVSEAPTRLRKQYNIRMEPITPPNLEEYYQKHATEFKTVDAYRLLHIEMSDSAALASLRDSVSNREAFMAQAAQKSENAKTRGQLGLVGVVKNGHCLPWDIGMQPELFVQIRDQKVGFITPVLRAPDTQKFNIFYLDSLIPSQVKPFDRAKKAVEDQLKGQGEVALDSQFVLVRMGDQALVTEADVLALREEIPPYQRSSYNRDRVVQFLVDWAVMARAAEEAGIDKSPEFLSWSRLQNDRIYSKVLQDSLLNATLGIPEAQLRNEYAKNPDSIFGNKKFHAARLDVATWIMAPDVAYQREFFGNVNQYQKFADWKAAKTAMFAGIRNTERLAAQRRLMCRYEQEYPVEVLDTTIHYAPATSIDALVVLAKDQYTQRQYRQALDSYLKLRDCYPTNDSLQRIVTFELAKLYNDMESFDKSVFEYRVFAKMWPQSENAYKAMFMEGFILSENLKKDSLALPVFKEMLRLYPKTDLSDDAEWMIRNIESGGALVPALLDSIANTPAEPVPAQ